jgi:hypothetical protein
MEMVKYLKLLSFCIVAYQAGMVLPASSQQTNLPIGTTNTFGSVGNFNASITQPPSSSTSPSSTGPSLSTGVLLPRGGRATRSNSTVTVCDDPTAPFPDFIDVCSLHP